MEAAKAWSVPHSILTGRVVKRGEPDWLPMDAAYAVALTQLEQVQCTGCGNDRRESMDAVNEFSYRVEPVRCHACAARDRYSEANQGMSGHGLSLIASKKPDKEVSM